MQWRQQGCMAVAAQQWCPGRFWLPDVLLSQHARQMCAKKVLLISHQLTVCMVRPRCPEQNAATC